MNSSQHGRQPPFLLPLKCACLQESQDQSENDLLLEMSVQLSPELSHDQSPLPTGDTATSGKYRPSRLPLKSSGARSRQLFMAKELMNTKNSIFLMISVADWICFLAQGLISALLISTSNPVSFVMEELELISISLNTGIVLITMEYIKKFFVAFWEEKQAAKLFRNLAYPKQNLQKTPLLLQLPLYVPPKNDEQIEQKGDSKCD